MLVSKYISSPSNATTVDVDFDNLSVIHYTSSLLEENAYEQFQYDVRSVRNCHPAASGDYPYGLRMGGLSANAAFKQVNAYRYNGKQLQNQEFTDGSGLEWYDYGARMYDPQKGRWDVVDPSSEKYYNWNPYNYTFNNPLNLIDPDGKDAILTFDKETNTITISSKIYITGSGASKETADGLNQSASSAFSKTKIKVDGVKYTVKFNVKYEYSEKEPEKLGEGENVLNFYDSKELSKLSDDRKISKVNSYLNKDKEGNITAMSGNKGYILGDDIHDHNTVLHETAHLLGLSDRYTEKGTQWQNGVQKRITEPHKGFSDDLMGNPSKTTSLNTVHYNNYVRVAQENASTAPFVLTKRIDVDNRGNLIGGEGKINIIK